MVTRSARIRFTSHVAAGMQDKPGAYFSDLLLAVVRSLLLPLLLQEIRA
ncbi:unnamed protein product, partial [Soboliphyme baturini]|uniref:Transposase n=1 Tax=Soboliphyme baturini TaxID=241478 RepID=A0A183JBB0_9BILA